MKRFIITWTAIGIACVIAGLLITDVPLYVNAIIGSAIALIATRIEKATR